MAYIDKELLLKDISETVVFSVRNFDSPELRGAKKVTDRILNAPVVDVVEVKHGHFVRNERNISKMKEFHEKGYALGMSEKSIFWTCSECGGWISPLQKYCSECGAKMDGERKDT
jgi:hypothetical protein